MQEDIRVFEAIQKSAGMETRPTSSGFVGQVSIPAALGLMDSPNAKESLWWPLEGLRTATISPFSSHLPVYPASGIVLQMIIGRLFRFLTILFLIGLLGSVLAFELYHADRIYPGVSVWGIDVGGMGLAKASSALEKNLGLDELLVTIHGPDRSWAVRSIELGLRIDPQATLAPAYHLGRDESWPRNLMNHFWLLIYPVDLSPIFIYDEAVTRLYLEAMAEQVKLEPTDASLTINEDTSILVKPARPGRRMNVEDSLGPVSEAVTSLEPSEATLVVEGILPEITDADTARAEAEAILSDPLTLMLAQPREGDSGPWRIPPEHLAGMLAVRADNGVLHATLDERALWTYLEKLAPALEAEPQDATFQFEDWAEELEVVEPSQDGRRLDVQASASRIVEELKAGNHHVALIVESIPPRYPDSASAEELGIVELVAEGDSYFIGSPTGRDHNIRLAASKFDGLIIDPGETFSFNHYLGEVSVEEGYQESFVTSGEQLAVETGGGICQVSTTAFRAAFWGGYPITERWYHTYRVGYYELMGAGLGMDATVYSPHVDFKFVNDRPDPLLIEAEIQEAAHRLIFRFYSTDDGRTVEKEGPVESDRVQPGPPIYQLDEELAPGTVTKWQSAVNGVTATIERYVYDADEELLYHDTFVSEYQPRRAAYHYGLGYEPPTSSTSEEASTP